MNILKSLQAHISKLDLKTFYIYCGAAAGATLLIIILMIFRFYSAVDTIKKEIDTVNEQREEIQKVLEQHLRVQKQRRAVDEMLKKDEDFKIGGYFRELIAGLGLENKKSVEQAPQQNQTADDKYIEISLSAEFSGMDMKEVCEILNKIDEKERIYTKELNIARSKKIPQKLDVGLVIATLQPQETTAQ